MKISVIIPAAGVGKRMGAGKNKQLLEIEGQTITALTIKQFLAEEAVQQIILVINPDDQTTMQKIVASLGELKVPIDFAWGGKERKDSVNNGIAAVNEAASHVYIHDGARPFVDKSLLARLKEALEHYSAVVPVVASKDTLKVMTSHMIDKTIDRSTIFKVQTPQCFTKEVALALRQHTLESSENFTDEASICEALQIPVYGAPGSEWNIKLTTPEDMVLGKAIYNHLKGENKCE